MKFIKPNTMMYVNTLLHVVGVTITISSLIVAYRIVMWLISV